MDEIERIGASIHQQMLAQRRAENEQRALSAALAAAWVPCAERMPEEGVDVMAWDADKFAQPFIAEWNGEYWQEVREYIPLRNVTHWMPLPAPPKD